MDFSVRLTTASADLNDETAWEEEYCARAERHYHMLTEEELRAKRLEARALYICSTGFKERMYEEIKAYHGFSHKESCAPSA